METEQARLASNPVGKGNTTMLQQRVIRKAINLGVVGLFGLGLLAVDSAPSLAGNCGGHCQVMKRCGPATRWLRDIFGSRQILAKWPSVWFSFSEERTLAASAGPRAPEFS
jgi:hypothetical protein